MLFQGFFPICHHQEISVEEAGKRDEILDLRRIFGEKEMAE